MKKTKMKMNYQLIVQFIDSNNNEVLEQMIIAEFGNHALGYALYLSVLPAYEKNKTQKIILIHKKSSICNTKYN